MSKIPDSSLKNIVATEGFDGRKIDGRNMNKLNPLPIQLHPIFLPSNFLPEFPGFERSAA